jgi:hypothetical protein
MSTSDGDSDDMMGGAMSGERAGEPTTGHSQSDGGGAGARGNVNAQVSDDYSMPEAAMGGADAVQKTSWGVASGTEPAGAPAADVTARTGGGGGFNPIAIVVVVIAVAVLLVYGFGIFG